MLTALHLDPDRLTALQASTVAEALARLASMPESQASLRSPALLSDRTGAVLAEAASAADQLNARRTALGGVRWASVSPDRLEALEADAAALQDTPAMLRLFSGKVKAAKASLAAVFDAGPDDLAEGARRLRAVVAWRRDADRFAADSPARALFGDQWRGWESTFADCAAARATLQAVELDLRRCDLDLMPVLIAARPLDVRLWSERLTQAGEPGAADRGSLADAEAGLRERIGALQQAPEAARSAGVLPFARLDPALASELEALQRDDRALSAAAAAPTTAWFTGPDEPLAPLKSALAWSAALQEAGAPQAVTQPLQAAADPARLARALAELGVQGERLVASLQERWSLFAAAHQVDERLFLGADAALTASPLPRLEARLVGAVEDAEALRLFAELGRLLAEAQTHGARWAYDEVVRAGAAPAKLADAYELALVRSVLLRFLHADGAELLRLGGAQLATEGAKFRELDRALAQLEARRILHARLADGVPKGNGVGPVGGFTELKLLELVCGQKRPRIALRNLVERAGRAIQAIKPVWMMSPTTVAQFAPPKAVGFDLIVIDEASQMTPEMAVGALGRGAQIVVVGDPKQLPPSAHFQVAAAEGDDEESEDGGAAQTAESVLDLAYQKLGRRRRLKWHYRSRHEQLIAFSNREFYDNDLVIFPSAAAPADDLGVRTIWAGGLYKGRVNEAEAKAVLNEAVGLMIRRPELSLGVVTMNADQRELLFQMFEDLKASDPTVRDYMARWDGGTEAFFVKNLENVQGDERDVMIICAVYGPAEPGARVMQRFGMINRHDEGHRRLNVLVTRAKRANWIVTSLRPNDVVAGPTTSRGVQAFQRYLAYAAGAPTVDSIQPSATPDSDFEVFVAERLRAHGYEVVHQVGVEKFRIDLGVRHPSHPLGYLAGVECDGAAYHSHYTVRDRDRIRQAVLEGLGWRIWRVWSTDWFNNPDNETQKLVTWLNGLRAQAEARLALGPAPAPAEEEAPEPVAVQPPQPTASSPVPQPEAPRAPPPEPAFAAIMPSRPTGRRHEVDGLAFYDDPALAGLFTVWDDEDQIGTIERVGGAIGPAKLFGGAVRSSLPEYRVTREWDETSFPSTDIFDAVRRLGREHAAWREPAMA